MKKMFDFDIEISDVLDVLNVVFGFFRYLLGIDD